MSLMTMWAGDKARRAMTRIARYWLSIGLLLWVLLMVAIPVAVITWLIVIMSDGPRVPHFQPGAYWLGIPIAIWPIIRGVKVFWRTWRRVGGRSAQEKVIALNGWLSQRGWTLNARPDGALPARGIPFTYGGEHTVMAASQGTHRGRSALVMYYGVAPFMNAKPEVFSYTIVAAFSDADAPLTMVEPQRGVSLLKSLVGMQDIDLESAEFNRRWRLVGEDVEAAHAIMQPTVIARLLEKDALGETISWDANAVMVVSPGLCEDFSRLEKRLDLVVDLADRMPAYQTKSGAVGQRVSTGSLTVGPAPKIQPDQVEGVLLISLTVGLLVLRTGLGGTSPGPIVVILVVSVALFLVLSVYAWRRRRRLRREWADKVNAER